jgi:hypothetical protein
VDIFISVTSVAHCQSSLIPAGIGSPKCGKFGKAQWAEKQKVGLLPIPYFHLTFTTDRAINLLIPANQKMIYNALRPAGTVRETLKRFGQKYLGERWYHVLNDYSPWRGVFHQFSTANRKGMRLYHKNHNQW